MAKRERRLARRNWRNTKLTIFKDLYRQARRKVSKLVHTAKYQVVNALLNRHPPKILPTIYTSANLPSIFIKHRTNIVEKLRASEHCF